MPLLERIKIATYPLIVAYCSSSAFTSVVYSVSDTGTGPEQRNVRDELMAKQRGMPLVKFFSVRPRMQNGAIEQNSDGIVPPS